MNDILCVASRRSILLAGLAGALGGCEPFGIDYKTLKTSLAVATGIAPPPGITLEEAAAIPYATIAYRLGSAAESMLILASDAAGDRLWTSSERRALTTRNGRIVASGGFPWNLSHSDFPAGDPLAADLANGLPDGPTLHLCDFRDVSKYSVPVMSTFENTGPETISILGSPIGTVAFVETCHCKEFDWDFQNKFWIDSKSGFVWQSQQHIHPNLQALSIIVLRPPS